MPSIDSVEIALRATLRQHPDSAAAHNNLGVFLRQSGRFEEAESLLRNAVRLAPGSADVLFNLALVLIDLRRNAAAISCIQSFLTFRPEHADAYHLLGMLHKAEGHWLESEKALENATRYQPDSALKCYALGDVLRLQGRLREAEVVLRKAISLDSKLYRSHQALGLVLAASNRMDEAEALVRRALEYKPGNPPAQLLLALILLKQGRYQEGWRFYESRYIESNEWDIENFEFPYAAPRNIPIPKWNGESLANKSLVIAPEQGLGDAIQFVRFMPRLKSLGVSRLAVVCDSALVRLFQTVDGIDEVIDAREPSRAIGYDVWCYMMSVPYHLGITLANIPSAVPYLRLPASLTEQWNATLSRQTLDGRMKVGIVWAGAENLGNVRPGRVPTGGNHQRSMRLHDLIDVLKVSGVVFVSLQMGAPRQQLQDIPPELRPMDMMDSVRDFADTAAIVQKLNMVITVDTSVAHVAGALGKPVWILSRFDSDWRWLMNREDSPWYPSARVFRQTRPDDWSDVVQRTVRALSDVASDARCLREGAMSGLNEQ
ncbi:tetratricopeptide repeat protein [Caballeronia sp. Lep1P3]|uniref:tetratricopeptide repeat-containing glycosyltransferase family protein n=1 Tax=Caballeronia sp. Lep1P3 TaxID=2878150 RepID=UPI001FD02EFB|nr:tetratricopeptide repeat-containing glycosyltransferase family protein [Caballeronia sp. Lep1P3]